MVNRVVLPTPRCPKTPTRWGRQRRSARAAAGEGVRRMEPPREQKTKGQYSIFYFGACDMILQNASARRVRVSSDDRDPRVLDTPEWAKESASVGDSADGVS